MRRRGVPMIAAAALVFLGIAAAPSTKPAPAAPVEATLELNQQFLYAGRPLPVRLTITNTGTKEVKNPVQGAIIPRFKVLDGASNALEPKGKPEASEPTRPAKLASKAFYGVIVDLAQAYPQLKSPGTYTIQWSSGDLKSPDVVVHVIPEFDPSKDYVAKVDTEEGSFVIDLLKKTAPIAVKAFVDMANSGFYDGLKIHEVRPDQLIAGGDPTGTGAGQGPFRYPAELAAIPVVAGSVVLKPASFAPPANASQFTITLRPEPRWTGQFTVLGQVVEGLAVVKRISNLPSTDRPSYRPIKDIHTLRVTIQEKSRPTANP